MVLRFIHPVGVLRPGLPGREAARRHGTLRRDYAPHLDRAIRLHGGACGRGAGVRDVCRALTDEDGHNWKVVLSPLNPLPSNRSEML